MKSSKKPWSPALLWGSAALLAALAGCGGGAGGGSGPGDGDAPPVSKSTLQTAADGEVLAYFKDRIQRRAAQGMNGTVGPVPLGDVVVTAASGGVPAPVAGTLLQEQGVDEDDRLKTDGTMLYALLAPENGGRTPSMPERLATSRILADGKLQDLGSVTLPSAYLASGLYLAASAGRLAVLSQKSGYGDIQAFNSLIAIPPRGVGLDVYSAAVDAKPAPLHHVEIDGWLVGSRRIGNVLYVVSSWMPDLSIYQVPANTKPEDVQRTLSTLTADALLPKIRVDGGSAQQLVRESDCYLQPANASLALQLTTITAFDLSSSTLARSSRCFVGDGNTLYMSRDNVYVASSQQVWIAAAVATMIFPSETRTDIHKFALQGLQVDYRGSGQVPGHLGWDSEKMPLRMSEHAGDLRVLSFTGETGWFGPRIDSTVSTQKPSPGTLTVLREDVSSHKLQVVGQLPNAQRPAPLGKPGEQVYGVHFAGTRGYVVTFRRTDPLYVLDLAAPADPRIVGELEMTGFSDYLYPLADGSKLLGIGRDASAEGAAAGLKIALMDVANPAQPRLLASRTLGQRATASALDSSRHGVNIFEQGSKARIALPVRVMDADYRSGYQGLARWEADTTAGTLVERPFIRSIVFTDGIDGDLYQRYRIDLERAAQSAKATYYLSGGAVSATLEP